MIKIAIYGKGGIGKSTTASNLSVAFSNMGFNVLQVGCDPKADSTLLLREDKKLISILDQLREKGAANVSLDDLVIKGFNNIYLCEAGGPPPGLGCAGRGIVAALEELKKKQVFEKKQIDIVVYDVLGDVVCGGFSMPIRDGFANDIFIVTSGENMALHAARNIALAVDNFKDRGYAKLGGVILNRRNVKNEEEKIALLCEDIEAPLCGVLDFSKEVQASDEKEKTVSQLYPNADIVNQYNKLAENVLKICEENEKLRLGDIS
ncbi:MAG: AAA family ATPase [Pleomorphochaeta sp.]|jgi:nitrogenase iron protein NifH